MLIIYKNGSGTSFTQRKPASFSPMDKDEFKKYLIAQREEILKHRWIESEKAGYDLGQTAVEEWIRSYAKEFRETWISHKSRSAQCDEALEKDTASKKKRLNSLVNAIDRSLSLRDTATIKESLSLLQPVKI